jgi:hypothetical protein
MGLVLVFDYLLDAIILIEAARLAVEAIKFLGEGG